MHLKRKTTYFTLKTTEEEIKILIQCIKGSKLDNPREQSRAWDTLNDFERMLGIEKEEECDMGINLSPIIGVERYEEDNVITGEYAKEIRASLLRKPSVGAIERNKRASELLKKLRR